jgi:hypothetical protein
MSANRLAKARRNVFLESPAKYFWIADVAIDDIPHDMGHGSVKCDEHETGHLQPVVFSDRCSR